MHLATHAKSPACTLTATVTATAPILCNGGTTSVIVSAAGGTEPYSGTGTLTATAGFHDYTVTDAAGCSVTTTISISEPDPLVLSECGCTGARCHSDTVHKSVLATGGTPPYSGEGPFVLTVGTFTFHVTDANGCTASLDVTITEPDTLLTTITSGTIACHTGNANVNIGAVGGVAPYIGTGTYTLPAGSYDFTVYDAKGCPAPAHVDLTAPEELTTLASPGPTSCITGTAVVTVTAAGGTAPYSGIGAFTVTPGVHTYYITDAKGCSSSTTIFVAEPAAITTNAVAGTINCHGGTATVNVSATGGITPYSGTGSFTVTAGVYNYTITDAVGCSALASVTLTQPDTIEITHISGTIACNGATTTVNISATGGTLPYSGTGTFSYSAGTHTYIISDANGCTASQTETLTEPPALVPTATTGSILCFGGMTTVNVTATGGISPYSGVGTYTVTAGTYNYPVTDAAGCTTNASATISEPAPITISATAGTISAAGGTTTVNISATGGTSPYTGTGTYTVSAGTYTYSVSDIHGCSNTTSVTITEPSTIIGSITAGTINCYGDLTTVTVSATGGMTPYTGVGTYTVAAGPHTYTITDAIGYTTNVSITITEPPHITASSLAASIICHGAATIVTVNATGGVLPYLGTGAFTASAGIHNYTVTDANGCAANTSITLVQPTALTANTTASPIVCNGGAATVTITGSGGIPPYSGSGYYTAVAGTHTYTITDANGCGASSSITIDEPSLVVASATAQPIACYGGITTLSITATGGTAPYSGVTTHNVSAGSYSYTIADAHGCSSTAAITVYQPDNLKAHPATTSAGCGETADQGTAFVTISGGTAPYRCQWDAAAGGMTTDTATHLRAGSYSVTVIDTNNCSVSALAIVTGGGSDIALAPSATNPLCYDGNTGTADLMISGGIPPYKCEWSNGVNTPAITQLQAGTYSVTVTDNAGCIASTTVTLTQPAPLQAEAVSPIYPGGYNVSAFHMTDGRISSSATGGTQPYSFSWSNGTDAQNLQGVPAGHYILTVTDANGCTAATNVELKEPMDIDLPEAFSPNDDGYNDYYVINGLDNFPDNKLEIFNRWGNLVYAATNYQNTWNGRSQKDEQLPDGTYYVVLKLSKGQSTRAASVEIRK
jgi:gliding motility-associated-like protein